MSTTVTVKGDNITLDLLLHRLHGVRGRTLVEAALDLNIGLADLGVILPHGTEVELPDLPPVETSEIKVLDLFR